MWTLLREISLRHLRYSPLRSGLVVFGIALGVAMLCAVLSANDVLEGAFQDMSDRVAGKADLTVAGSSAGIPSSMTGELAELEGVAHAAATLEVVTRSRDAAAGSVLVMGVDFLGDTYFLPFAEPGSDSQVVEDPLAFVNDPTAILISEKLAKERKLKEGDVLPLFTADGFEDFYVRGLLEDSGPTASFGGQVVVMFIDAAQVAFSRGYLVDRIDVVLDDEADQEATRARIEQLVEGRARVEEPHQRTRRMVDLLFAMKRALNLSSLIALCVGMFLIYNAVAIAVAQRRREVGTLRALGLTRRRVVQLFCLEAMVMASVGILIGLGLATVLARHTLASVRDSIDRLVMPVYSAEPTLSLEIIINGVIAGFLVTLVAAYFPARRSNRVDPAEALRATRSSSLLVAIPHTRFLVVGMLLTLGAVLWARFGGETGGLGATGLLNLAAAFFVPAVIKLMHVALTKPAEAAFGIPGRLALDNVNRALGRSAVSVVALMLAVAMSMSVSTYAHSLEESLISWATNAFAADAVVTSGSPVFDSHHLPFPPESAGELEGIDGLLAVGAVRSVNVDFKGRRVALAASESRTSLEMGKTRGRMRPITAGPSVLETDALYEAPRVLISSNMARLDGLEPGDSITLPTPTGNQSFEVYAVVVDYGSDQGTVHMDRRWFSKYWDDNLIDGIELFIDKNADRETVVREVRARLGNREGLFVSSQQSLQDALRETAQRFFAYAKAPEIISMLVAIMGVIGTMLAAIIDRMREIGMLRAIGATRRQVSLSLVVESAFLGLGASLCGVLAGVPVGYILLKVVGAAASGWDLEYYFPYETALRMSALVVGCAALSGLLPGFKASGVNIQEALSYE